MSHLCKWCDCLTNNFVKLYDEKHRLVWAGCYRCFLKQKENLDWTFENAGIKELTKNVKE